MDNSPKFGFPYLTGEAQAEVLHNEFIQMVQAILQGVEDKDLSAPPGSPTDGDSYIVGGSPTGLWSGRANSIAIYDGLAGGWLFVPGEDDAGTPITMGAAQQGLRVYVKDEGVSYVWSGSAWVVETGQSAAVQTTDATQTVLVSGAMAADSAHTIRATGHGREDATGDTYHFEIFGGARNEGGTSSAPTPNVVEVADAGAATWDATFVANDTSDEWEIKVTGEAAHTIDWTVTYLEIAQP